MKKVFLLFVALCFFCSFYAQNTEPDSTELEEVIIQNERIQIPYSEQNRDIRIIDSTLIKSLPVNSINDLLSHISGVDVRRRGAMGNQADIGINGGTFDQTLVLVNGMKMSDPQTGHLMMNLPFNLNDVKRIEILKGPAAAAYGVNALNGAINIVTKQPEGTGLMVDIQSGTSFKRDSVSHHLYSGLDIAASAHLSSQKTRHFLSVGTTQSNGHRYNTSINNNKLFYTNQLNFNTLHSLKMMGGYIANDFGANGFFSAPQDTEAREKVQTAIGSVEGDFEISKTWTLKPGVSYRYNDDYYVLDRHHPEVYENQHYTNVFNGKLNNSFRTGIGKFGVGTEWRNEKINSNSLGYHSRNNIGFFGNYNVDFIKDLSFNLGVYGNYNNDFGWDWMPSVDFSYEIHSTIRLYANAGTAFRLPTYTDLYYSGPMNIGNKNLNPEKSWETAVGLKYNKDRLKMAAEYFYRDTDDFIDWVKAELDDPWKTLNYQNITTHGISLSGEYELIPSTFKQNTNLSVAADYTYLNPTIKTSSADKISNYALGNLRHQLNGRVNLQFFKNLHFTLSGKYEERVSYKDYFLWDARFAMDVQPFEIYLDAHNLTHVEYTEAGATPMPGRWINIGVKWKWEK